MKHLPRAVAGVLRARRDLDKIKQCPVTAPLDSAAGPVRCDLIAGHTGHHRHRYPGQLEAMTWR